MQAYKEATDKAARQGAKRAHEKSQSQGPTRRSTRARKQSHRLAGNYEEVEGMSEEAAWDEDDITQASDNE